MVPYKWKFWKRKKPKVKPTQPAELMIDVTITGYDKFINQMQEMEKLIKAFGVVCEQAGEKADSVFDKLEITYKTFNYHISTAEPTDD